MTTEQKIKLLKVVSKFNDRNMPNGIGADVDFSRKGDVTVYVWEGRVIESSFSSYDFDTEDEFINHIKFSLK